MKLLLIGLNYSPEPVGIGPYTTAMAEGLARRGIDVTVVAGAPYYPQWRRYPGFAGLWRRSVENGVTIVRCAHYVPARPSGWRRIVHLASFAVCALVPALKTALSKPDIVLCVAPALLSVPVARVCAALSGARLWVHVQDFEVEAAFATGLVSERGAAARLARGTENWLLRMADRLSTISPQMVARAIHKGVPKRQVTEIRNWADPGFIADPTDGATYRVQWNLGARKVALYSGNIGNKQGIETLIDVAGLLADRPDIVLVICGEGPNRARLSALAQDLPNIQLHDLQPAERMGQLLALAEVHLLPQIEGAADLVLPSKLTNMLASGRPVIATALPGTGLFAEIDGCGIAVPPGDPVAMAQAIKTLMDAPAERKQMGDAARERALERWSQDRILDRLAQELLELANS